ncbi:glycosyltransferase family 2 protein [Janibacter sp. G56]|uniref:glycosyltransferase family 2 protein n=1 Tax=Janibacter sp. G56 TaxID=3418717 RepID=UPI003D008E7E
MTVLPPKVARARELVGRAVRLARSDDPADRRRIVGQVRARLRPTPTTGLDDLTAAYARAAEVGAGPDDVAAAALRTRSGLALRVLRHLAEVGGRAPWRLALAEVLAGLPDEESRREAHRRFAAALSASGPRSFTDKQQLLLAQLDVLHGEGQALERHLAVLDRVPADVAADLRADLRHPGAGDQADADPRWLAALQRRWVEAGLLAPVLSPVHGPDDGPGATPFDRLETDAAATTALRAGLDGRLEAAGVAAVTRADLPLITVVMSVHRTPDAELATAVRSVLAQTWPALELVLVDDASGPEQAASLRAAAALDPRVRVLSVTENGGTYRARNLALRETRGAYVTFCDSDDWAHPERLERQVLPLLLDPDLAATESEAVRCLPDLRRTWLGYPATRTNASSLLVRREIVERLGGFDPVRKSGDAEFAERLAVLAGERPRVVDLPLQIVRLRADSLSRSDFAMGWAASERIAYLAGYRQWHARLREDEAGRGSLPDLERVNDEGARPFAAPRRWLTGGAALPAPELDVVVVDDLADPKETGALVRDLGVLLSRRLRVGVLHREDLSWWRRPRRRTREDVQGLIDAGAIHQVHPEEPIRARALWVRTPSVLVADRQPPADLSVDRVHVSAPRSASGGRVALAWTRAAVESELRTWSPAKVEWIDGDSAAARAEVIAGLVSGSMPADDGTSDDIGDHPGATHSGANHPDANHPDTVQEPSPS